MLRFLNFKFFLKLGVLFILLGGFLVWFFYSYLRPELQDRTEIYKGVFLTVEEMDPLYGSGRVMIAEIHWDTPGVELYFRPFYPRATGRKHFSLLPTDWLMWSNNLDIAVNSTSYHPYIKWKGYPFKQVDSVETIVWRGNISHMDDKSYIFGWDEDWNFLYQASKPPSVEFLSKLNYGISTQGIIIENGVVNSHALNYGAEPGRRTFLGVDPEKKILWLIVYEKANDVGMTLVVEKQGIKFGGKMDAGDATHMVVGFGAKGVTPHTGIRGKRCLGNIIGIRAEPLD